MDEENKGLSPQEDFDKFLEEFHQETLAMMERNRLGYEAYLAAGGCPHSKCMPQYDSEKVKKENMSPERVRELYPRFCGQCPDCGEQLIQYASFEHYLAGDW
jgi:hypothetical protein